MYLYIGKEIILEKKEIIGIFNIESILKSKEFEMIINEFEKKNKIKDISNGEKKTLILCQKNDNLYGVISNISSLSIGKRNKKMTKNKEEKHGKI